MTSSPVDSVAWDAEPKWFPADPMATIALDRPAWSRLGARFAPFDHELGEVAYRATGSIDDGRVPFGIVDHSEDTTYLVADPRDEEGLEAVLAALETIGVAPGQVLERMLGVFSARDAARTA